MNCKNILYNVEQNLFGNIRKKDFKRINDFKIINDCKEILKEEIEKNVDEENNLTKKTVFDLTFNYFEFNKKNDLKYLIYKKFNFIPVLLMIPILYVFYFLFIYYFIIDFGSFDKYDFIIFSILNLVFIMFFLILILSLKIKDNKKFNDIEIDLKKIFIFEETFILLNKEIEQEEKDKLLKPDFDIRLEEEEINELLSDIPEKPEITPKVYDKKASMERRKRRKTR